jgi:type VI secretion system protein VasG
MIHIELESLSPKLNSLCLSTLDKAAALCNARTNYNVEVEHWLLAMLDVPGTDLEAVLKRFEVDTSRLTRDLTQVLDALPRGNARDMHISETTFELMKQAWLSASLTYHAPQMRSGHLILALVSDRQFAGDVRKMSRELAKINPTTLTDELANLTASTLEATMSRPQGSAPAGADTPAPARTGRGTAALDQFTINLTQRAREGKIDPVIGRDPEIRQVIDILMRRRQNNPILTGEAGVGKTAVVEGFALLVAAGQVPPAMQNVAIHSLDLGLLQAGAGVKGEFEQRLKNVIEEVKASPTPIIMFIDEAHTLVGAGGQAGQGDAANLLKPALARGEFRTIAATTWAEYKKYFEEDAALARRFQPVRVEEPSERTAIEMMRGLVGTLEKHHGVPIENEAVVESVRLSRRYITGRQLPDKSVSLLDTACASIALSQASKPPAIQDLERRIEQIGITQGILQREEELGASHEEQKQLLDKELADAQSSLQKMTERWEQERSLVEQLKQMRAQLAPRPESKDAAKDSAEKPLTPEQRAKVAAEYDAVSKKLVQQQGESPLVHSGVTATAIAATVASWTGIPLGRMLANEMETVLKLKESMEAAIIGQSHALDAIAQIIRTSRAQLGDPSKPIGVFMLAGPSGVGKTETAITLANLLYGGEQNLTVLNMSEYKEEVKVSQLMGASPGYVGYGKGGVLTEAVRRKPYSVILLDEMEKAHPGVQEIFYQVFDKGAMKDGEGRDINFRNCVILITTNAGSEAVKAMCSDPDTMPEPEAFTKALFPKLLEVFKPAFLGRTKVVPYYPLGDAVLRQIIGLKLGKVKQRVRENHKADLRWTPEVVEAIASRCTEADTGARNIDHILSGTLLPELSTEFLSRMAKGEKIRAAEISMGENSGFRYVLS